MKKLLVLLALPTAGLLFFALSGISVPESLGTRSLAQSDGLELSYLDLLSASVRSTGQERGMSLGFLASNGQRLRNEMAEARRSTDKAVEELRGFHKANEDALRDTLQGSSAEALAALDALTALRSKVDGLGVPPLEVLGAYSGITAKLVAVVSHVVELSPDAQIYFAGRGYYHLLDLLDGEAQVRGLGITAIAAGSVSSEIRDEVVARLADSERSAALFLRFAPESATRVFREAMAKEGTRAAQAQRKVLLDWPKTQSMGGLTQEAWFSAQSANVAELSGILSQLSASQREVSTGQESAGNWGLMMAIGLTLLVLVVSVIPALLIARGIIRPLHESVTALEAVATGDFSQRIDVTSRDEVGQLGNAINTTAAQLAESQVSMARSQNMVENAPINMMLADRDLKLTYINPASLETFTKLEHLLPCKASEMVGRSIDLFHKNPAHQRKILSDPNNLPYHAQIQLGPEWLELDAAAILDKEGNYLGPMVSWTVVTEQKKAKDRDLQVQSQVTAVAKDLNDNSTNLVTMSNTMAANAEENSSQANNVSAAAEQVSANVSSVAAAVEEMSATIQEVSKTVTKSSEVTQKAVQMSKKASGLVTQLGEASNEISQVTKVIASIAQQTNILALNATIEAARAGEAGKGFAVVANEVKELAKSTAKMTEDISTRIAGIQQSTGEAVISIEEINRIMSEVDTLSSTVASAVEEQTATTNEISRSMTEATTGVNEIVRNITGVATAAKDTSKQAVSSKEGAEGLGQLAGRLQEIVELFAASNAARAVGGGNGHANVIAPPGMNPGADNAMPAHLS